MIEQFTIGINEFLSRDIKAYYSTDYRGYERPGNPDYINDLKNTFDNFSMRKLNAASEKLQSVLRVDLPLVLRKSKKKSLMVCVVPRAKDQSQYSSKQLMFKSTVRKVVDNIHGLTDGTDYILRHTNTKTTHLRYTNCSNDGRMPYRGITMETCRISGQVKGRDILLVDDIYTKSVNVDEDAIQALLDHGARSVVFYAVAKTRRNSY